MQIARGWEKGCWWPRREVVLLCGMAKRFKVFPCLCANAPRCITEVSSTLSGLRLLQSGVMLVELNWIGPCVTHRPCMQLHPTPPPYPRSAPHPLMMSLPSTSSPCSHHQMVPGRQWRQRRQTSTQTKPRPASGSGPAGDHWYPWLGGGEGNHSCCCPSFPGGGGGAGAVDDVPPWLGSSRGDQWPWADWNGGGHRELEPCKCSVCLWPLHTWPQHTIRWRALVTANPFGRKGEFCILSRPHPFSPFIFPCSHFVHSHESLYLLPS